MYLFSLVFFVFDYSCIFVFFKLYFVVIVFQHLYLFVFAFLPNFEMGLLSTGDSTDQQWQCLIAIDKCTYMSGVCYHWLQEVYKKHTRFWCVFEQEKHTLLLLSLNHQARELALLKRPHIAKCQNLALLRAVNVSYFSFSCRFDSTFISTFSLKLQAEIWDRKLFKKHLKRQV